MTCPLRIGNACSGRLSELAGKTILVRPQLDQAPLKMFESDPIPHSIL